MSDYLLFLSTKEYADKHGIYTPAVQCDCGNACDGDEPKIYIKQCEQCEDRMIEHEEGIIEIIDRDDKVWMSTCCGGSATTELVEDGDIGVAICSECRDWSDFELEEE